MTEPAPTQTASTRRQHAARSAMPPITFLSSPCRYSKPTRGQPGKTETLSPLLHPGLVARPLPPRPLSTKLLWPYARELYNTPEGRCPTRQGTGPPRCSAAPEEGVVGSPSPWEGRGKKGEPLPPARFSQGRVAAGTRRPSPAACNGHRAQRPGCPRGGAAGAAPPEVAAPSPSPRRALAPCSGAQGPPARRERSAAAPQGPSPGGAAPCPAEGGIGPRFPGLSLRAARGDRGLQRPVRPRPEVASFPRRPSEPGGGEGGRGTCAKRCWGGGRWAAGRRAPQPLPGGEQGVQSLSLHSVSQLMSSPHLPPT